MGQFFLTLNDGNKEIYMDISMLIPKAATKLGYFFEKGIEGFSQDYERALMCYESAAQKGDETALNNLGWMYVNGYAVPKDEQIATGYFYKAATKGSSCAMVNMGNIHESKKSTKLLGIGIFKQQNLETQKVFSTVQICIIGVGALKKTTRLHTIFLKHCMIPTIFPVHAFILVIMQKTGWLHPLIMAVPSNTIKKVLFLMICSVAQILAGCMA